MNVKIDTKYTEDKKLSDAETLYEMLEPKPRHLLTGEVYIFFFIVFLIFFYFLTFLNIYI